MRFLVLSDLHGKRSEIGRINKRIEETGADFVLFLGDITDFGPNDLAADILDGIESDVYAIPGNCDPLDLPSVIAEHGMDMHGRFAEIDGVRIAGLGGSNPTIFDTPFELSEEEIYKKLKPVSKKGMILMTHAPAYGYNDVIPSGLNVGSTSVLRIVKEYEPMLVLSGHIHEASGVVADGCTVFVNPGPAKDGYCAAVTLEGSKADAKILGPADR